MKLIDKRNWTKVIFFNNQDSLLRPKNFLQLTWNFLSQLYLQTKQMWICRNKQTTCHFYNNWVKKKSKEDSFSKINFLQNEIFPNQEYFFINIYYWKTLINHISHPIINSWLYSLRSIIFSIWYFWIFLN